MNKEEIEKEDREHLIKVLTEHKDYIFEFDDDNIKIEYILDYIRELEFQNTAFKTEHNYNITRIKKLEQKESILDKVTDQLKKDISEAKEKIKYWEEQYRIAKSKEDEFYKNSYKRQINRWQSRFETLRGILNFIKGEENNGR